jgi:predicted ATPase
MNTPYLNFQGDNMAAALQMLRSEGSAAFACISVIIIPWAPLHLPAVRSLLRR